MSKKDMNWLLSGFKYQTNISYCPFCGQEINASEYLNFSKQINKFINSKQKQKADNLSKKLQKIQSFFDVETLTKLFETLSEIYDSNSNQSILHSPAKKMLSVFSDGFNVDNQTLEKLYIKILEKTQNPYDVISLTEEEIKICSVVYKIIVNFKKFCDLLSSEKIKIEEKIKKQPHINKVRHFMKLHLEKQTKVLLE